MNLEKNEKLNESNLPTAKVESNNDIEMIRELNILSSNITFEFES